MKITNRSSINLLLLHRKSDIFVTFNAQLLVNFCKITSLHIYVLLRRVLSSLRVLGEIYGFRYSIGIIRRVKIPVDLILRRISRFFKNRFTSSWTNKLNRRRVIIFLLKKKSKNIIANNHLVYRLLIKGHDIKCSKIAPKRANKLWIESMWYLLSRLILTGTC